MKFHITVKNRIAEVLSQNGRQPYLVCDNADNSIVFSFDSEWDAYHRKTARFVYRENNGFGKFVYKEVTFTGNTVALPVFHNVHEVYVGVSAGSLMTTTAARLSCLVSIYGFSGASADSGAVETKSVALALADGDQLVLPSDGYTLSAVTIKKPVTLIPENIRFGVSIAGVVGSYRSAEETDPPAGGDTGDGDGSDNENEGGNGETEGGNGGGDAGNDSDPPSLTPSEGLLFARSVYEDDVDMAYHVVGIGGCTDRDIVIPTQTPDGYPVTGIYQNAFSDNTAITSVVIPEGVTRVCYQAFSGCSALKTVTLPMSVFIVAAKAFEACNALRDVYYKGTSEMYNRLAIGSGNDPFTAAVLHTSEQAEKPETLGTPSIAIYGDLLRITVGDGLKPESFEVYAGGELAYVTTETAVDLRKVLDYLPNGSYTVHAVACIDSEGKKSPRSNSLTYTVDHTLSAPRISIDLYNVLTIVPGKGDVQSYEIYEGKNNIYSTTATTVELDEMLPMLLEPGTYTIGVKAVNYDKGLRSEMSNTVSCTVRPENGEYIDAPYIFLSGDDLIIEPGMGLTPESYEVYVGGEVACQTTEPCVDLLSSLYYLEAGTYEVFVVAWGNNDTVKSPNSNSISYTVW